MSRLIATDRLTDIVSLAEVEMSGAVSNEVGVTAAENRLPIPSGKVPPASIFLVIPGGRIRPRRAKPGGTSADFSLEESGFATAVPARNVHLRFPQKTMIS